MESEHISQPVDDMGIVEILFAPILNGCLFTADIYRSEVDSRPPGKYKILNSGE